jgi:alkylation response protein AidB-like acyl-CoA dehydrogenase
MQPLETLHAVRRLQDAIRARAGEIEQARRLPDDLVEDLARAGCYRLFPPAWKTGSQLDYCDVLRVIEALAEADGSVGWTVSQCALGQVILGYLPRGPLEEIYAAGPDVRVAGVFAPKGRASRIGGAWHVTGCWPFATGCQFALWMYMQCVVIQKRRVLITAENIPVTRLAVFRAEHVEILDTWDALGLRGTGSHDVQVKNRICAEAWTCSLAEADGAGEGIQSVPLMDHAGLLVAAVAVGIATGAVDDVKHVAASGKRPAFNPRRLADDPVFQDRLGEAHMRLRAARALLYSQAKLVECAMAGAVLSAVDRASLRATCRHVTALAVDAADAAYTLAGSSSVLDASPLQRRLRDIHTATQHAWNSWYFSQNLGVSLLGDGPKIADILL